MGRMYLLRRFETRYTMFTNETFVFGLLNYMNSSTVTTFPASGALNTSLTLFLIVGCTLGTSKSTVFKECPIVHPQL